MDIIEQCYKKSVELLLRNSNKYGLMASSLNEKSIERRYINIFGRDSCISSLGMIASKNKKLINIAKKSINSLSRHQSKLGQIPYSINPYKKEVSFYYMGDKDSTLWWLIAIDFYNKNSGDKKLYKKLRPRIDKALNWLFYQDQNNCGLIEQCESADWADLMPSNGNVLYTNILWLKVLELYGFKKDKKMAYEGINILFSPHEKNKSSVFLQKDIYRVKLLNYLRKHTKKRPYYLNYVNMFYGNERCDVFGNVLSIIFGVAKKEKVEKILNYLIKEKANKPRPISALFPNIEKTDYDWADYLKHRKLNYPYQYHNGGSWPFLGAFWVIALHKAGKINLAREELKKVAEANSINSWQFNEWFHGETGKPMGMNGQSWNAGTFLLAYHYLKNKIKI
ncbi:MAG: glycoside hydrolase 100 family protein [Candidatus Falkowbacteria bacterium]